MSPRPDTTLRRRLGARAYSDGVAPRDDPREHRSARAGSSTDPAPGEHGVPGVPGEHGVESEESLESLESEEVRAGTGPRIREAWRSLSAARRRFVVVGVILGLLGTAVGVWFALAATATKPNWRDVSYDVVDDQTVDVRFEVTKPRDMTAVCTVLAQETNHGVVGRMQVTVGPSGQLSTITQTRIRTTSLAVIGTVRTCAEQ